MSQLAKIIAATGTLAAGAALAVSPAAAQVAGIATTSPEVVIARAAARNTAYQQIGTTYAAQIRTIGTMRQEIQTLQKSMDTNNDNQLSEAEIKAKPAVVSQIRQKEDQVQQQAMPITMAQAYALEQLAREYDAARQQVISAKRIQIMLTPDAIQYAPPAVDVTNDIVTALNTRKPTVTTAVPAGWQPSREIMGLQQAVQQILVAAAAQQQQGAAATPAAQQPTAPKGR